MALLEDAYITSSYIPRDFRVEETARVKEVWMRCLESSERLLVELARYRAEVFRNLKHYLKIIVETVKELDRGAEVYLFGSIVEGGYTLSSDIDVLVVTGQPPERVLVKLWERGIEDPFEIHVVEREMLPLYRGRSKMVRVEDFTTSPNPRRSGRAIKPLTHQRTIHPTTRGSTDHHQCSSHQWRYIS
ncbi:MAG: nucleotidyltransferase domain-containing protein [Ignisphaera sp.]